MNKVQAYKWSLITIFTNVNRCLLLRGNENCKVYRICNLELNVNSFYITVYSKLCGELRFTSSNEIKYQFPLHKNILYGEMLQMHRKENGPYHHWELNQDFSVTGLVFYQCMIYRKIPKLKSPHVVIALTFNSKTHKLV